MSCQCGCGRDVKATFIRGHNLRIKNPMDKPEAREKARRALIGRQQSPAERLKRSEINKGERNPFFGKHHSEATKEQLRQTRIGVPVHSEEEKKRRSIRYSGQGNPFYGKKHSPEVRELIRARTPVLRGEQSPNYGKKKSEETRRKISESRKGIGKGVPFSDDHRQKILKALKTLPTKSERLLLSIIEENSFPFRYVGDGEVFIARRCPDFINYDGQKQIIELAGEYWHTKEDMEEKAALYAKYGFSTLVIWASELRDEKAVENRIRKFLLKEVH